MTTPTPAPNAYQEHGYARLERTVRHGGTSARVNVPKDWRGRRVVVIAVDPDV